MIEVELKRILEETYKATIQYGNMYNQGAYHMATTLATKFLHIPVEEIRHLEQRQAEQLWQNAIENRP